MDKKPSSIVIVSVMLSNQLLTISLNISREQIFVVLSQTVKTLTSKYVLSKHAFSLSNALHLLGTGDIKNFTTQYIVRITALYSTEVVEIL